MHLKKGLKTFGHNSNANFTFICSTEFCIPFSTLDYNEQLIESTLRWFYRVILYVHIH